MNIHELESQGFIPSKTVERMTNTTPGTLARVVDRICYDLVEEKKIYKLPIRGYLGKDGVDFPGRDGDYYDVRRALREVCQILEALALKNVL